MKGLPHEARSLVSHLTPNTHEYAEYSLQAHRFIKESESLYPVVKCSLKESVIFKKKYLVVYVDDEWFNEVAGDLEAFVMPDLNFIKQNSPAAALIPASKMHSKQKDFLSILEHEFVHLNQWIKGYNPGADFRGLNPSEDFIRYLNAEFQAYFIQYSFHPEAFRSLENGAEILRDTCAIKALNQATIKLARTISVTKDEADLDIEKTFSFLQAKIKKTLGKMGVTLSLKEELAKNFPIYFMKALVAVCEGNVLS